jgi:hypothetical protein
MYMNKRFIEVKCLKYSRICQEKISDMSDLTGQTKGHDSHYQEMIIAFTFSISRLDIYVNTADSIGIHVRTDNRLMHSRLLQQSYLFCRYTVNRPVALSELVRVASVNEGTMLPYYITMLYHVYNE